MPEPEPFLSGCDSWATGTSGKMSRRLLPAVVLFIAGTVTHSLALRWLAVPVGLAWGVLLCWRSVQLAQQRLESHSPEVFARVRTPAS